MMDKFLFIIVVIVAMVPLHGFAAGLWSAAGALMPIDATHVGMKSPKDGVELRETDKDCLPKARRVRFCGK